MPREGKLLAQAGSHSQGEPEQGLDPSQMNALCEPGSQLLTHTDAGHRVGTREVKMNKYRPCLERF